MKISPTTASLVTLAILLCNSASADTFSFDSGSPDGLIATASRPVSSGKGAIESADDFVLSETTMLDHATFTGLIDPGATVTGINVEIYQFFPLDSTIPESGRVPTRTNSPSDAALVTRESGAAQLSFTTTLLSDNFTAANSVLNGINPQPGQKTGGEGPISGQEVQFDVALNLGILLPAGHYFFVPQVAVDGGDFFWLSAATPVGGLFPSDSEVWIRDETIAPDWLRVGTDIAAHDPFNASFSVSGTTSTISPVPEAGSFGVLGIFTLVVGGLLRKGGRRSQLGTIDRV